MKNADKKVCLISLGCPKNLVSAELMLGSLKQEGFLFTTTPEEAEVIVVNTCGFIEASKRESIDKLLEAARYKESGNCRVLVASGCLTQRYSQELAQEMPEVDLFVGLSEFDKLPEFLRGKFDAPQTLSSIQVGERILPEESSRRRLSEFSPLRQILPDPDRPRVLATPKHFSYLKISEGCSHRCSFCVIPHIRGDLKSRTPASILHEVEQWVERGVREFNLIAQDLNEYGKDLRDGSNLAGLLQALNALPGDFWLRPLYLYPLEFSDSLIGVLRDSEKVVKYIDMPLQHISDRILRSMKRGSPGRYVRQVLAKLKQAMPEAALRTTFIVGYPGETDAEFAELCDFVQEIEFDRVGVFTYSQEEGTPAATLPDAVPDPVKQERLARLMEIQQAVSLKKNQALLGRRFRVLVDGPSEESELVYQGRLYSQAPEIDGVTYLSGDAAHPGEFLEVEITQATEYDLVGELVPGGNRSLP
ncbi:MAG TPA: 30S ribosomal protein S12 methylthiotransferase RimO [Deltaproteobacteria bacterium]|nr:30S ribosomal protein S12 methylthiotransferase RimO [Deltaproteobacteria bacterium]